MMIKGRKISWSSYKIHIDTETKLFAGHQAYTYLREQGVSEEYIPGDHPNLLCTLALVSQNFMIYLPVYTLPTAILSKTLI